MKKYIYLFFTTVLFFLASNNILKAQEKFGPTPTKQQLAWHEKEFYLFMHFGPNTFTNLEWGKGSEDPNVFNPTQIDCNQWASIAKASGAKGIIITAKHHDGFSLWPSKFSKHTVRESKWMNGKGDVIKMLLKCYQKLVRKQVLKWAFIFLHGTETTINMARLHTTIFIFRP